MTVMVISMIVHQLEKSKTAREYSDAELAVPATSHVLELLSGAIRRRESGQPERRPSGAPNTGIVSIDAYLQEDIYT